MSGIMPQSTHGYQYADDYTRIGTWLDGSMGGSAAGGLNTLGRRNPEEDTPAYWVEHLATFPTGKQYGIEWPTDGIRKLKQMERSSAIWAQPMLLRLTPKIVRVENENGEMVEQFPMDLIADPTAHLSSDPRDVYNNILLFVVKEDRRSTNRSAITTEMHIFQCNRVSANEVVEDIRAYMTGNWRSVRPGHRDTGFVVTAQSLNGGVMPQAGEPITQSYTRTESRDVQTTARRPGSKNREQNVAIMPPVPVNGNGNVHHNELMYADEVGSATSSDHDEEHEVNTLNRCFDDIERFVTRIQSAAVAQRELEAQAARRSKRSRSSGDPSILAMRAQLPTEAEFVDIFQKFKLSFNLLAKLKNNIHEPNAPELLHFLFTPLTIILDACKWGLGRNVAPQVVSPLLARETRDLLENCLTSKENKIWKSLGEAWEDWPGPLPPPYRPVFADGFMPYGAPSSYSSTLAPLPTPVQHTYHPPPASHLGVSSSRRSVDNLTNDFDRMSARESRETILERERRLLEGERHLEAERMRLAEERRQMYDDAERRSVSSERPMPTYYNDRYTTTTQHNRDSLRSNPAPVPIGSRHAVSPSMPNLAAAAAAGTLSRGGTFEVDSPRQRAFVSDLQNRRARAVRVTYDRVGQNNKELTVSKGEYLEVLNDTKNWWECRNVHNRIGYVPHTILSIIDLATHQQQPVSNGTVVSATVGGGNYDSRTSASASRTRRVSGHSAQGSPGGISHRSGLLVPEDAPEYVKRRQGKRGEFRYF